jgi:DNA-binding response OmpR family regulator
MLKAAHLPTGPAPILLASADREDHIFLRRVLGHPQWQLHATESCREALNLLNEHRVGIAICERDLPDGSWRDLLEAGTALTAPPRLIVCSRRADEYLWAEVLNLGGYDVPQ